MESSFGVTALYKHGRRLVGDCSVKSRLEMVQVTESHDQFVDNFALHAAF